MSKLERKGDALMIVGSPKHEVGQTAFSDLGCSVACEEERARLTARVLALEERNRVLEMYLTRYSGQEVDGFLNELAETKAQLRQFQRHIECMPWLIERFERYSGWQVGEVGKSWVSMQGALQWLRVNDPGSFACGEEDGKYQEFMLPIYARWMIERHPNLVGKIELRRSRFDGYRPWSESYKEAEE